MLYYIIFDYIILYYIVLYSILYYILYYIIFHCSIFYHIIFYDFILYYIVLYYIVLYAFVSTLGASQATPFGAEHFSQGSTDPALRDSDDVLEFLAWAVLYHGDLDRACYFDRAPLKGI